MSQCIPRALISDSIAAPSQCLRLLKFGACHHNVTTIVRNRQDTEANLRPVDCLLLVERGTRVAGAAEQRLLGLSQQQSHGNGISGGQAGPLEVCKSYARVARQTDVY